MDAEPPVGRASPTRILMVVVFPAPLGPMNPRIWPRSTARDRPSSATNPPYFFVSPFVTTTCLPGLIFAPFSPGRPAANLQARGLQAPQVLPRVAAARLSDLDVEVERPMLVRPQQAWVVDLDLLGARRAR